MKLRKLKFSIAIFCLTLVKSLSAQDIHWSQFNDNPIFQNPALAGHFYGDYRFHGNYRDQWRSVTVPFSTFSLSADSRVFSKPNLGYGLIVFHDVAGDGNFRTIEIQGNIAYHLRLNSDSTQNLRFGMNLGMNHRQINWDNLYWDNQFNGIVFDPTLPSNENYQTDRKTNLSIGTGAVYEIRKDDRNKITAGIGFFNLNRPNQGFYSTSIPRDIRFNFFARGIRKLDVDWDLLPSVQVNLQGVYREILIGSSAKYTIVKRVNDYKAIYGGIWYRNRDAAFLSIGMDYNNWFAGISYDINFSKLVPASRTRGGIELAVRYVMFHFRPSKSLHRVCPDYI
jgi:type IX secretion system PorP/SprF family membrane protein